MKRILLLIITASILSSCSDWGKGFKIKESDELVSWSNEILRFETERKSTDNLNPNPAFQLYTRTQDGKVIRMPADTYSMGYGASCPMGNSGLYKPDQGISKAEILLETTDQIIIHLKYEPWIVVDQPITLDKQVTLFRNSPIMKVIDYYDGMFELLNIAAVMSYANVGTIKELENGYAIEYPFGVTTIIIMPNAQEKFKVDSMGSVFVRKAVSSGEPLRYYVGISDKGVDYLLEELNKIL